MGTKILNVLLTISIIVINILLIGIFIYEIKINGDYIFCGFCVIIALLLDIAGIFQSIILKNKLEDEK